MAARTSAKAAQGRQERRPEAEELLGYYREMLLIRRFEEKAGQLYGMGLIGGFCHLYIGQEAVAVGIQHALQARRQRDHRLPRPWPHAGLQHGPAPGHGRADRAQHRLLQGQGRLDAHVRPLGRLLWRPRHRRRPDPARHRPRLRAQISGGWRRLRRLHGRRRRQPGPGLRELQHGGALEAADPLCDREQPLRHGHRAGRVPPPASGCASAAAPTASPGIRSTAWTWWRCTPRPASWCSRSAPARGR